MTIQPSILIWTIICFCLLMLILSKLLFGPMLSFMDARQEKIDRAREKQQADRQRYAEGLSALEAERALEDKNRVQAAADAVADAQTQAQDQLARAKAQQEAELVAYVEALKQESHELKTKLDIGAQELAETFSRRLVS